MNGQDNQARIKSLKETVEKELPKIVEMANSEDTVVILHQDSFAADYQLEEYVRLGMVIKFLGLYGKEIRIINKNEGAMNDPSLQKRIQTLKETIKRRLPNAFEMVNINANNVILHQDTFAADYHPEEYKLLGVFIKDVGLSGKEIYIIGGY